MSKIGIFMADGCEEIEALTVVDICRRAGVEVETISIYDRAEVTSSHKVTFKTDTVKAKADYNSLDGIVLPGGLPGTNYLREDATVQETIKDFASEGKLVAAICAAPTVLGGAGLLNGKKAICYPGLEDKLLGATVVKELAVTDGNIITGRGMGAAIEFSSQIVAYFLGADKAKEVKDSVVYPL